MWRWRIATYYYIQTKKQTEEYTKPSVEYIRRCARAHTLIRGTYTRTNTFIGCQTIVFKRGFSLPIECIGVASKCYTYVYRNASSRNSTTSISWRHCSHLASAVPIVASILMSRLRRSISWTLCVVQFGFNILNRPQIKRIMFCWVVY